MGNLIEIIYENSGRYPEIYVNGEQISRFMSLSNYIYDDVFRWADKFYEIMDGEIAEGYTVSVFGHPYHAVVLKAAMAKSEYCDKVIFSESKPRISIAEKYEYVCRLKRSLGEEVAKEDGKVVFYCDSQALKDELVDCDAAFSDEDSDYGVFAGTDEASDYSCKYKVIISESNGVKVMKNFVNLFVRREDFASLVDYVNTYHVMALKVEEAFASLADKVADGAAKQEFEAYSKEELRVYVPRVLPSQMEIGESVDFEYSIYPKCFGENDVVVSVEGDGVSYADGKVTASGTGRCTLTLSDRSGKLFYSQKIEVCKHNFATNISIILPTTTLTVGETLTFRCIVTPTNAEDANQLTYTVSDENVAVISGINELYAVSAGRVCVTVSTPRISKKFYVSVPPKAYDIAVSAPMIKLPFAAEATVYGAVVPSTADPMPELEWVVEDDGVAKIVSEDGTKCVLESRRVGRTVLICRTRDREIQKRIEVEVPKEKGCYVATSVYGSYDCPEVWVLRRYRDNYLAESALGRAFIKLYYAVSPTVVKCFGKTKWFNAFWKKRLDKMVKKLGDKGYEDTPYIDN